MRFIGDKNVLIVAKCIVNELIYNELVELWQVLIVAKCIVNVFSKDIAPEEDRY